MYNSTFEKSGAKFGSPLFPTGTTFPKGLKNNIFFRRIFAQPFQKVEKGYKHFFINYIKKCKMTQHHVNANIIL
jgi:hypothetical protein